MIFPNVSLYWRNCSIRESFAHFSYYFSDRKSLYTRVTSILLCEKPDTTLEELSNISPHDFLMIHAIGPKSLAMIINVFELAGIDYFSKHK